MSRGVTTQRDNGRAADRLRRANAFTLVELLVVIGIIGLLAALLLPAVQMARESSRRATCASTLRQWGLGVQSYEQSYAVFPVGMSEYRCFNTTWIPALWSYIDQQPLADRYNWGAFSDSSPNVSTSLTASPLGPMSQRLSNYYCPSDKPNAAYIATGGIAPRVNYVLNSTRITAGTKVYRGPFRRYRGGSPAPDCGDTSPGQSWVRLDLRGYTGPGAWRASHIIDGLSATLMMAEAIVWPGEAVAGLPYDPRGILTNVFFDARITPNSAFDMMHGSPVYGGCVNSLPDLPCQATGTEFVFAARSRHSSGVQAVMCDGSVRFVSDLVNQSTWQALGTMNGREVLTSDE